LLPVERFGALLELVGVEAELIVAAEEELQPALRDHWSDVCAAFADEDAHHLYVRPEAILEVLAGRARIWLSALGSGQEIALRLAVFPAHRLLRRRRAERDADAAEGAVGRGRRGLLRSFSELRTGDIVVHEDHGVARFAGFETRTVAGITRDYLYLEYQGDDRVFAPTDQLAKISRYVGAGGEHPPLSRLGGTRWETMKARARRAAQQLSGELLSLYAERRRRRGHAF